VNRLGLVADLELNQRISASRAISRGLAMTTATFKPSPEQRKVIDHRGGHLQVHVT
jgi:hypothetical protein